VRSKQDLQKGEDFLVHRLKAGEQAAASELVDKYYEQIYLFMRRLGHSPEASEDLVQQSFLAAWQNINQLRRANSLNGWIYRIAVNASKLYRRKHAGKEQVSIEQIDIPSDNRINTDIGEYNEQIELLKNAIANLPVKLRQAVVLHYMQQLTISEAAAAVGVSQGTVKSRLNRALKALRKQIGGE